MEPARTGQPVIFGEVLFDRFPDGSVVLGGAPFNVAWNLQALGLPPVMISRVGRDELGDRILDAMRGHGLDTRGIQRDPHHATGTVEITLRDGEPEYEIAVDRAYDFLSADELPPLEATPVLYHGSLALRTLPPRAALAALRLAANCPILMDVNLRTPWWEPELVGGLLREARWGKLNEAELAELVPQEKDTPAQAARLLGGGRLQRLIVTRGAEGVWVGANDGSSREARPPASATVLDTVGAGDAFSSVVLLGLVRGWDWALIIERSLAFAAAVVGLRGATTGDAAFYETFRKDWELQ